MSPSKYLLGIDRELKREVLVVDEKASGPYLHAKWLVVPIAQSIQFSALLCRWFMPRKWSCSALEPVMLSILVASLLVVGVLS